MKKLINLYFGITALLLMPVVVRAIEPDTSITFRQGYLTFHWDIKNDQAEVVNNKKNTKVWRGSLLPSFWLQLNGKKIFVKGKFISASMYKGTAQRAVNDPIGSELTVELALGNIGRGRLIVFKENWGIRFSNLDVEWYKAVPAIIEMYFGASSEILKNSLVRPTWEKPFMPDWQSILYCVPGAKEGPVQSYFRMWDFGQANIALGNFGPSTGTLYGAAFPRPVYFAGMGSNDGFIGLGAGSTPDGAMSLHVQSTRGCFQYLYREDIWGALKNQIRNWKEPLRITISDNAWQAFKNYYESFPLKKNSHPQVKSIWNTWGEWRNKKYPIRPIANFAKKVGSEVIVIDDGWETGQGSGEVNYNRFPEFDQDIDYVHKLGLEIGVWETVGWISEPFLRGLTEDDLIRGTDGKPCKANWNFNQGDGSFYCLDISSSRVQEFLRNRTVKMMKKIHPSVIKLDFGYGLPSPIMGVPKDFRYRGERYSLGLIQIIVEAAKSVDSNVIIKNYGISPLLQEVSDLISLDDQGDLWYNIKDGHQQWSLWASLLSDRNTYITGSSGYDWHKDDEVILNTFILGTPNSVLPIFDRNGSDPVPERFFIRRKALNNWYRRSLNWNPVWLNSDVGNYSNPIKLNCWGRMEWNGSDSVLTAVALREGNIELFDTSGGHLGWQLQQLKYLGKGKKALKWQGRWALVSQNDEDIFNTSKLAVIPFDRGQISIPYSVKPLRILKLNKEGESDYRDWEWQDGCVVFNVNDSLLNTVGGFLITK